MRKAIIRNRITGKEWECVSSIINSMTSYGQPVWENEDGEALCNDTDKPYLKDPHFDYLKLWNE